MKWPALTAMLLIASCAGSGGNLCAAFRKFTPDPSFEDRWTTAEKRQAVAHNEKIDRFCR